MREAIEAVSLDTCFDACLGPDFFPINNHKTNKNKSPGTNTGENMKDLLDAFVELYNGWHLVDHQDIMLDEDDYDELDGEQDERDTNEDDHDSDLHDSDLHDSDLDDSNSDEDDDMDYNYAVEFDGPPRPRRVSGIHEDDVKGVDLGLWISTLFGKSHSQQEAKKPEEKEKSTLFTPKKQDETPTPTSSRSHAQSQQEDQDISRAGEDPPSLASNKSGGRKSKRGGRGKSSNSISDMNNKRKSSNSISMSQDKSRTRTNIDQTSKPGGDEVVEHEERNSISTISNRLLSKSNSISRPSSPNTQAIVQVHLSSSETSTANEEGEDEEEEEYEEDEEEYDEEDEEEEEYDEDDRSDEDEKEDMDSGYESLPAENPYDRHSHFNFSEACARKYYNYL